MQNMFIGKENIKIVIKCNYLLCISNFKIKNILKPNFAYVFLVCVIFRNLNPDNHNSN